MGKYDEALAKALSSKSENEEFGVKKSEAADLDVVVGIEQFGKSTVQESRDRELLKKSVDEHSAQKEKTLEALRKAIHDLDELRTEMQRLQRENNLLRKLKLKR